MNFIILIVVLAAFGLLGFVTKSIIAILLGAAGVAIYFLIFCTGILFTLIGKVVAFVISLILMVAISILVPALLIVIIPGILLAFWYVRKNGYYGFAGEVRKRKAIEHPSN